MYSKGKTVKLSNTLFDIESFFIKLWNNILMKAMETKFFIQKNYNTKIITLQCEFSCKYKMVKAYQSKCFRRLMILSLTLLQQH